MEKITEFFHAHGLTWTSPPLMVLTLIWAVFFVLKYLLPSKRAMEESVKISEYVLKEIYARIDEAVKRAPPVEDPKGAPFEEYRKDLLRMVDGEISIDEFVDIWRGRKVQKRPKPEDIQKAKEQAAKEQAEKAMQGPTGQATCMAPVGPPGIEPSLHEVLRGTFFRGVFREWALHVRAKQDATIFSNMFLDWLSNFGPEARKACSAFVVFMQPRSWREVLPGIQPYLEGSIAETFMQPEAEDFYEAFRAMVVEQIRDYWEEFPKQAGKSGHVHHWTLVSCGNPLGMRECACGTFWTPTEGEIRGGIQGACGASGPSGVTLLHGATGPHGATGAHGSPTGIGSDTFNMINSIIKEFSKGLKNAVSLNKGDPTHGDNLIRWHDEHSVPEKSHGQPMSKYRIGQWVRVTRPTSPAFGQLGRISLVKDKEAGRYLVNDIEAEIRTVANLPFIIGLSEGEFNCPAIPKVGEWWIQDTSHPHAHYLVDTNMPICWNEDLASMHKDRIAEKVASGCLVPYNFGRAG